MTDRDRLIELIKQGENNTPCVENEDIDCTKIKCGACVRGGIADYLLANGVIVPPVDVGQTVWYVDDFTEEIEECKVYGFNVVNGKLSVLVDNGECKFITRKWHNTKEKAEEKLRELKENA